MKHFIKFNGIKKQFLVLIASLIMHPSLRVSSSPALLSLHLSPILCVTLCVSPCSLTITAKINITSARLLEQIFRMRFGLHQALDG